MVLYNGKETKQIHLATGIVVLPSKSPVVSTLLEDTKVHYHVKVCVKCK